MNIRKRARNLAAAALVIATAALTLGVSSPAWAGGDPNGGQPAPIVAPAGFAGAYKAEAAIVNATCVLKANNSTAYIAGVNAFDSLKAVVDSRLAGQGYGPSPDYTGWTNSPADTPNCPRG